MDAGVMILGTRCTQSDHSTSQNIAHVTRRKLTVTPRYSWRPVFDFRGRGYPLVATALKGRILHNQTVIQSNGAICIGILAKPSLHKPIIISETRHSKLVSVSILSAKRGVGSTICTLPKSSIYHLVPFKNYKAA